jgi:hypothetical protein
LTQSPASYNTILLFFLAIVLVPTKWVIFRICGDIEAQNTSLLSIPEDICYVSLGVILGDSASSFRAFKVYFRSSDHFYMDMFVTGVLGVIVAILVHWLSAYGVDHWKSWRASNQAISRTSEDSGDKQFELPITPIDENIRSIGIRHLVHFSFAYAVQLVIAVWWLSWVASVLSVVQS